MRKLGIGKRLAVIGAATVAFAGASAITASPAHATPGDCSAFLAAAGYGGLEYGLACTLGDLSYTLCTTKLTLLSVPPATADVACRLAAA
ncbi:hypothetical protein [Catellatospora sp. NPDC049111]|jgi:hypothetical protein|uniref:Uncharacterized protein n=1 Tax=Catellatospora aurea TaxID=1337874 RepID=A0ABW2GZD8_9ACTN